MRNHTPAAPAGILPICNAGAFLWVVGASPACAQNGRTTNMLAGMTRKSPYAFLPPLARLGRGGTVQRVQDALRYATCGGAARRGLYRQDAYARVDGSRFPVSSPCRLRPKASWSDAAARHTRAVWSDMADCRRPCSSPRARSRSRARNRRPRSGRRMTPRLDRNTRRTGVAHECRTTAARFHEPIRAARMRSAASL